MTGPVEPRQQEGQGSRAPGHRVGAMQDEKGIMIRMEARVAGGPDDASCDLAPVGRLQVRAVQRRFEPVMRHRRTREALQNGRLDQSGECPAEIAPRQRCKRLVHGADGSARIEYAKFERHERFLLLI